MKQQPAVLHDVEGRRRSYGRLINRMGLPEAQRIVWRKGASIIELETLYRERGDHFVRVAAAVIGNGEIGRDVVQEAFAIAIRECATFRGPRLYSIPFRDHGRHFYALVALGRTATTQTRDDALRVLDRLRFSPTH